MIIIPAVIGKDFSEVEEKLLAVGDVAEYVQLDIVDGEFAKPISWPYTSEDDVEDAKDINEVQFSAKLELHLMVIRPEEELDQFLETKATRILVHYEATDNHEQALTLLDMSTEECGLVLNMETPIDVLEDYIHLCDVVQLMSIRRIGAYGQTFDDEVIEKIKQFKKRYKKVSLQLDGGMGKAQIPVLRDLGVNAVAVGSAIFKAKNPREALEELNAIAQ